MEKAKMCTFELPQKSLRQDIEDALFEARQMHVGEGDDKVLLTAQRLSGAPAFLVKEVMDSQKA